MDNCKYCIYSKQAGTSLGCTAPDYVPSDKCEKGDYYDKEFIQEDIQENFLSQMAN